VVGEIAGFAVDGYRFGEQRGGVEDRGGAGQQDVIDAVGRFAGRQKRGVEGDGVGGGERVVAGAARNDQWIRDVRVRGQALAQQPYGFVEVDLLQIEYVDRGRVQALTERPGPPGPAGAAAGAAGAGR
jgi:hypothetical protein